jgi:hypothetical protein
MSVPRARRFGAMLCVLLVGAAIGLVGCSKKKPKSDAGATQPTNGSAPVAGPLGTGSNLPLVNLLEPRLNFDVAALGYDPYKPDMTLSVIQWPHQRNRFDSIPESYFGKIIATQGRVAQVHGSDEKDKFGKPTGRLRVGVYLADPGGKFVDENGKDNCVSVTLAASENWRAYRPGKVVKVVGRADGAGGKTRSVLYLWDAVLLSAEGEGNPSMTPEQVVKNSPKGSVVHSIGERLEPYTILIGVVSTKQVPSTGGKLYVNLVYGSQGVLCQIFNQLEYNSDAPKPGDTITIIGRPSYAPYEQKLSIAGLYHSKK